MPWIYKTRHSSRTVPALAAFLLSVFLAAVFLILLYVVVNPF
jgi:hypothetical protein